MQSLVILIFTLEINWKGEMNCPFLKTTNFSLCKQNRNWRRETNFKLKIIKFYIIKIALNFTRLFNLFFPDLLSETLQCRFGPERHFVDVKIFCHLRKPGGGDYHRRREEKFRPNRVRLLHLEFRPNCLSQFGKHFLWFSTVVLHHGDRLHSNWGTRHYQILACSL